MKKILILSLFIFSCNKHAVKGHLCSKEEEAIKIAENKWLEIYGEKIYGKKPFKAKLNSDSIWIIKGTLHTDKGGVPYAEIDAKTCKIIKVTHGK